VSDTLHYAPPDDLQGLPADLDIEGVGLPVPFAANELLRDMPANKGDRPPETGGRPYRVRSRAEAGQAEIGDGD
jgi:hypothetical protein